MKCPKCGYEPLAAGARFCESCGQPLSKPDSTTPQIQVNQDIEKVTGGSVTGVSFGQAHDVYVYNYPGGARAGAAGSPPDTGGYDLQVVRDLLLAAFTASDLRRLFLYTSNAELRPLTQVFGPSDGLAVMVEAVIQFCLSRNLLPDLEKEVQHANPRQYARFAGRLRVDK